MAHARKGYAASGSTPDRINGLGDMKKALPNVCLRHEQRVVEIHAFDIATWEICQGVVPTVLPSEPTDIGCGERAGHLLSASADLQTMQESGSNPPLGDRWR